MSSTEWKKFYTFFSQRVALIDCEANNSEQVPQKADRKLEDSGNLLWA